MYDLKCQKTHISAISVHKYHKCVFLAYLTVLRLITTVWPKKSENSYLHHFSAQVSQIVFFAYLTVLQLITTLRPKMSENSYLHHLSAQVSQIVFLAYLTVLRLITTVWPEMSENSYLLPFQRISITNRVLNLFDRFTTYYNLYDLKCQKTHISAISVHKYHKSCSYLISPFYDLLQQYDLKCQKTHISTISVHKYHKSCS